MKQYFYNLAVSLDQFLNTLFGGSPDETMSSRVYRYRNDNWCAGLVYRFLDWISPRHCEGALEPPDHHEDDVLK